MMGLLVRLSRLFYLTRFAQVAIITAVSGLILSCAISKQGGDLNIPSATVIQDIRVTEGAEKTVVEIEGEEPMIYTTFRLSDPNRLVIDMAEVSLAQFRNEIRMENGPVRVIRSGTGGGSNVSRLEFELSGEVKTDVRIEGLNLIVEATQVSGNEKGVLFFEEETPPAPLNGTEVASVPEISLGKQNEMNPMSPSAQTVAPLAEAMTPPVSVPGEVADVPEVTMPAPAPAPEGTPLSAGLRTQEQENKKILSAAQKVLGVRFDQGEALTLVVSSDGVLSPRAFFIGIGSKQRLVVDLPGVTMPSKLNAVPVSDHRVKQVRFGNHKDKLRLVLDLLAPVSYSLKQSGDTLEVLIQDLPQEPVTAAQNNEASTIKSDGSSSDSESKAKMAVLPSPDPAETPTFAQNNEANPRPAALPVSVAASVPEVGPGDKNENQGKEAAVQPVLPDNPVMENAPSKPPVLTPAVSDLQAEEKAEGLETKPASPVDEKKMAEPTDKEEGSNKKVLLRKKRRENTQAKKAEVALENAERTSTSQKTKFTGRKISLDFQDAEVTNVIRLISDVSGLNFVLGEDVKGKITLKLNDIPWDQALDIMLEIRNLGMVREGDIIRVTTLANLTKQRNEQAEAKETQIRAEELLTRVVYINYAKAEQMKTLLLKLLSARGEIMVASRVNALVVKDIETNLGHVEEMAKKLDTKTPQVLIEARIVEVQPKFKRSLGVQWGADFKTNAGGNSIGIGNFTGPGSRVFAPVPSFSVNAPAASPLGGVGFSFGRFTESPFQLDLRISAGESQEMTRIVSTPKIMVLDNNEALIKQGAQIPFQSSSANGGTNVQLIDASLQLKVTPHISLDGGILLELNLTKNEPGPPVQGSDQPSIFEKEVTTQILLMDGETMVIGGIYETKKIESEAGIPYLKDIPGLGWLFKSKEKEESTTELLIFITPTVMS